MKIKRIPFKRKKRISATRAGLAFKICTQGQIYLVHMYRLEKTINKMRYFLHGWLQVLAPSPSSSSNIKIDCFETKAEILIFFPPVAFSAVSQKLMKHES